jgi:cation transport ATPase
LRPVDIFEHADSEVPLRRVPAEALRAGQIYAVASGQVAPVCGRLLGQEAEVSLAWINGNPSRWLIRPAGWCRPER